MFSLLRRQLRAHRTPSNPCETVDSVSKYKWFEDRPYRGEFVRLKHTVKPLYYLEGEADPVNQWQGRPNQAE